MTGRLQPLGLRHSQGCWRSASAGWPGGLLGGAGGTDSWTRPLAASTCRTGAPQPNVGTAGTGPRESPASAASGLRRPPQQAPHCQGHSQPLTWDSLRSQPTVPTSLRGERRPNALGQRQKPACTSIERAVRPGARPSPTRQDQGRPGARPPSSWHTHAHSEEGEVKAGRCAPGPDRPRLSPGLCHPSPPSHTWE